MIDRHYGHLARDGREHAIKLLDALNPPSEPWTLVDVAWTPKRQAMVSADKRKAEIGGGTAKPSDGLEPSTPSLPSPGIADAKGLRASSHPRVEC